MLLTHLLKTALTRLSAIWLSQNENSAILTQPQFNFGISYKFILNGTRCYRSRTQAWDIRGGSQCPRPDSDSPKLHKFPWERESDSGLLHSGTPRKNASQLLNSSTAIYYAILSGWSKMRKWKEKMNSDEFLFAI